MVWQVALKFEVFVKRVIRCRDKSYHEVPCCVIHSKRYYWLVQWLSEVGLRVKSIISIATSIDATSVVSD